MTMNGHSKFSDVHVGMRRRTFLAASLGAVFGFSTLACLGRSRKGKGTLYLIGGSADTSFARFVELAGGKSGKILVLPHASSDPHGAAEDGEQSLKDYGAGKMLTIMPGSTDLPPDDTTAVFMTGGDQSNLVKNLQPAVLDFMKKLLRRDGVVGGTSAGAAGAPETMIAGGLKSEWPDAGSLLLQKGLGLLPGYIVDTHVHQRGRFDRLMVAVARVRGVGGIGLDNDTAVEIRQGMATVHGAGLCRLYRRSSDFGSPLGKDPQQSVNVRNVLVSLLPAGERFRL